MKKKTMWSVSTKLMAIILTLVLLLQISPVQTLAETVSEEIELEQSQETDLGVKTDPLLEGQYGLADKAFTDGQTGEQYVYADGSVGADELADSPLLGEEEERREENIKVFRREDGIFKASIYDNSVHYEENGEWKEIDNTLLDKKTAYVNTAGKKRDLYCKNPFP